ncbi:MAG: hypothetical protein WC761_00475 [Candidatus Paceibacterota bacterium]|jgi:hypothetical protein
MQIEFTVPSNTEVIFVADLFQEDYIGGAELTTEAIISMSPGRKVFKLHSASLTAELVEKNKDKIWVLCNWMGASREGISALVLQNCNFSVVEYDYKYCKFRSSHLHRLETAQECDCHKEKNFAHALYKRAKNLFFMSEGQRDEYIRLFPTMSTWKNISVLSSVWTTNDIFDLLNLSATGPKTNKNKWAVLSGGSWIKNQKKTEEYCKAHLLPYDLVGGLPYKDFLTKLSEYKGLVFHPAGFDTCPRLVVEAKLLGLALDINSNVQHMNEAWFAAPIGITVKYLLLSNDRFWSKVL